MENVLKEKFHLHLLKTSGLIQSQYSTRISRRESTFDFCSHNSTTSIPTGVNVINKVTPARNVAAFSVSLTVWAVCRRTWRSLPARQGIPTLDLVIPPCSRSVLPNKSIDKFYFFINLLQSLQVDSSLSLRIRRSFLGPKSCRFFRPRKLRLLYWPSIQKSLLSQMTSRISVLVRILAT